jgi:perosamine synthetase
MIPIYKPYISKYKSSAIDAINSEWISNHGKYIKLASDRLKDIIGTKYCILMNNGTSSTHCLFKALKFKYPNIRKIYVPNNVFVAPWNCGLMEYTSDKIEVMKIDHNTLNIDTNEEYIKSLDTDSAVCIVHNLGNIINVPRLKKLRPDLVFIEDNCEGLFGKYDGRYSGSASLCSAVSFYGNKTITTGEGGAFFTDDESIFNYITNIYSHGMSAKRYIHCNLGTNFRMTNIQAAFLYDQLNDLDHILSLKKQIFLNYNTLLSDAISTKKIKIIEIDKTTEHSNWMYAIILTKQFNDVEKYMKENNIEVRPFFYDIHSHSHLNHIHNPNSSSFSKSITDNCVLLPSYPELSYEEQKYICDKLILFIEDK